MTSLIEAHPELIAPESWGGLDITDYSAPLNTMLPPEIALKPVETKRASLSLAQLLSKAATGNCIETPYKAGAIFNPTAEELPDGTVMIVENDQLTGRVIDPFNSYEPSIRPPETFTSPPIREPYTDYWRENQDTKDDHGCTLHFGSERAHFPTQCVGYSRYLQWGVLATNAKGQRGMQTWAFSAPTLEADGNIQISEQANARQIPFEIGVVSLCVELNLQSTTVRVIDRVKGIRAIISVA